MTDKIDSAVEHAAQWVCAYFRCMQDTLTQLYDLATEQGVDLIRVDSDDLHRACQDAADKACGPLDMDTLNRYLNDTNTSLN